MRRLVRLLALSALAIAWIFVLIRTAHAGGPLYVAGATYFNPAAKGEPIIWAQGIVSYYTDPGDLSPVLPHASADALVADAFTRWTHVPNVALTATLAGNLAEDVNGSNVTRIGGVLSLPADIQPSAVTTPVGIVYDLDGQVTETLLGTGSSADCLTNGVYGGVDNFVSSGNFAHALVILNGICVQNSSQLFDFEYRLIRVLGHVIGLGASQANINVWTGTPTPTSADQAGFPVLHAMDPSNCLPITNCLLNADQPKMDDRAALGRLYPNGNFLGSTARIHGTVTFPANILSGQGMQGVNVVARWLDPVTLQASRTYVATTVSGNLYRGNNGNPVTGFMDPSGQPYARWGSDDTTVQGFYDLSGLEFPDGGTLANYEISVERIDLLYSEAVGSYAPLQVLPSGASAAVGVVVVRGTDNIQDLAMTGGALAPVRQSDSQDYLNPVPVRGNGEWMSWFNPSGGTNYYSISAQANRTLSVEVETLDELGNVSLNKAQPVIGMWSLAAPPGTPPPAATPNPFNTVFPGLSRLDAQVLTTTDFRIGVTDWRGDGRPDYGHRVRVLYADTVHPARIGADGGNTLQIQGWGFRPGMVTQVGGVATSVASSSPNLLILQPPAMLDGLQTVLISDPATGGVSTMTQAVTVGAGASDTLQLLPVANPAIPVGGTTPNPLQFLVLATDGTPVVGATVALSSTNGLTLDPCSGAGACSVFTDESGYVTVNAGVTAVGTAQVTAQLAPASYPNPSTAIATLTGVASTLDIALLDQITKVEQGMTVDVPLLARVLNAGSPLAGKRVDLQVVVGSGTLSAPSAITDGNGNASATLHLTQVTADVQVTACVAPLDNPCKTFTASAVPVAALQVHAVDGTQQVVLEGQAVLPVAVRVTDNAIPPNPVLGANVSFFSVLAVVNSISRTIIVDDVVIHPDPETVLLGSSTTPLVSDGTGLAQLAPWASPVSGGEEVGGYATVDSGAQQGFTLEVLRASRGKSAGARLPGARVLVVPVTDHGTGGVGGFGGFAGTFSELPTGDGREAQDSVLTDDAVVEQGEPPGDKADPDQAVAEGTDLKNSTAPKPAVSAESSPRGCDRCSGMVCSETAVR